MAASTSAEHAGDDLNDNIRAKLIQKFGIEDRPAEAIRSLADLIEELEERLFLQESDDPLDSAGQRTNLVNLQLVVNDAGIAYPAVTEIEVPEAAPAGLSSQQDRAPFSGAAGPGAAHAVPLHLTLHPNHEMVIQLVKEACEKCCTPTDIKTLLRYLGASSTILDGEKNIQNKL